MFKTTLLVLVLLLAGCESGGESESTSKSSNKFIPVANAGNDQYVMKASTVVLDGTGSFDADLATLTYDWSLLSKPEGSNASLSDITLDKPTFIADYDGSYVAQLIVNDGTNSSIPDTVTITAISNSDIISP